MTSITSSCILFAFEHKSCEQWIVYYATGCLLVRIVVPYSTDTKTVISHISIKLSVLIFMQYSFDRKPHSHTGLKVLGLLFEPCMHTVQLQACRKPEKTHLACDKITQ